MVDGPTRDHAWKGGTQSSRARHQEVPFLQPLGTTRGHQGPPGKPLGDPGCLHNDYVNMIISSR